MPRPLKKPEYSKQKVTQELLNKIADAFGEPYDDRNCMAEHKPIISSTPEARTKIEERIKKLYLDGKVNKDVLNIYFKYFADVDKQYIGA